MAKDVTPHGIHAFSSLGRVIQHDQWLNQSLITSSDPTFGSLHLDGDATINGNLYVRGNTAVLDTTLVEFEDNIILLNKAETGFGVTLQNAGLEVERGQLENFRAVYNEPSQTFRIGLASDTQAVATRQDSPLSGGVAVWNATDHRFDAGAEITIPIRISSTEQSNSVSSGALVVDGDTTTRKLRIGSGILEFDGQSTVFSGQRLTVDSPLYTPQGIFTQDTAITETAGNLCVFATESVAFSTGAINIPRGVPVSFGSVGNMYSSPDGNLVVSTTYKTVFTSDVQYTSPVFFGDTSTEASLKVSAGTLLISSTGDVNVSPALGMDIVLPPSSGVRYGDAGRVYSSPGGDLVVKSENSNVILDGTVVSLPNGVPLVFGSAGSISASGGNMVLGGSTRVDSSSATAFFVHNAQSGKDIFVVDGSADGTVRVDTLSLGTSGALIGFSGASVTVDALRTNGFVAAGGVCVFNSAVTFGSPVNCQRITGLASPVGDSDAVSKGYVDLLKAGLFVKDSVSVATVDSVTLSNVAVGSTIDNYVLGDTDRLLVKNQVNAVENGVYVVYSTSAQTVRASDFAVGSAAGGTFTFVQSGSVNASLGWVCTSPTDADTVGTDPVTWTQFTGLGHVVAGAGLTKNFNELNVAVDMNSIEIANNALRISSSITGTGLTGGSGSPLQTLSDQSHVTSLGTIASGTWNATPVDVAYGGTGAVSFSAGHVLIGNGTGAVSASPVLKLGLDIATFDCSTFVYNKETIIVCTTGPLKINGLVSAGTLVAGSISTGTLLASNSVESESLVANSVSAGTLLADTTSTGTLVSNSVSTGTLLADTTSTGNLVINGVGVYGTLNGEISTGAVACGTLSVSEWNLGGSVQTLIVTGGTLALAQIGDSITQGWVRVTGPAGSSTVYGSTGSWTVADTDTGAGVDTGSVKVYSNTNGSVSFFVSGTNVLVEKSWKSTTTYNAVTSGAVQFVSSASVSVGDFTSTGTKFNVAGAQPVFGYALEPTMGTLVFERSVAGDTPVATDTLPSQTGVPTHQLRMSTQAVLSTGWVIGYAGETRRVREYNTGLRIATLDAPFTNIPTESESVDLYSETEWALQFSGRALHAVTSSNGISNGNLAFVCGDASVGGLSALSISSANLGVGNASVGTLVSGTITSLGGMSSASIRVGGSSLSATESTLVVSNGLKLGGNMELANGAAIDSPSLNFRVGPISVSAGNMECLNILTTNFSTGTIHVISTSESYDVSSGSLIASGGIGVSKDAWIGGDLHVGGAMTVYGALTNPVLGVSGTSNCTVTGYENSTLVQANGVATFTATFLVTPTAVDTESQFLFGVPGLPSVLAARSSVFVTVTGYSDDASPVSVVSPLAVGVTGSTSAQLKFQPNSTSGHFLSVMCRYVL